MLLAAIRFFFYLINSQIGCISRKSHKFIFLMFTGLQFCSLLGDWGFLRERASSQATKRLSLCSLFSS